MTEAICVYTSAALVTTTTAIDAIIADMPSLEDDAYSVAAVHDGSQIVNYRQQIGRIGTEGINSCTLFFFLWS